MGVVWITIIAFVAVCQASPLPHKTRYYQQQEGGLNVRADLENFIFLVMPTSPIDNSAASAAANGVLEFFLSKSLPLPHYKKPKKHLKVHHQVEGPTPDAEQFIESKTAPYHVDISRTRSHLAKLHPEIVVPENIKEDIIIARSPSVALSKSEDSPLLQPEGRDQQQPRSSRAILITVPIENEFIQRHGIKDVIEGKGGEDIKKTVGLTTEAINKGLQLADELQNQMKESKKKMEIVEVVNGKPEKPSGAYVAKLEEIVEEVKNNVTINKAVVMAKVIQAGLVEYFRKIGEHLKEQAEKETPIDEDGPVSKVTSGLTQKARKTISVIKEKSAVKDFSKPRGLSGRFEEIVEKLKEKLENINTPSFPNTDLEPPKMPELPVEGENKDNVEKPAEESNSVNKENSKEELLLLGAENEQCGPDQERDPSGICRLIVKS